MDPNPARRVKPRRSSLNPCNSMAKPAPRCSRAAVDRRDEETRQMKAVGYKKSLPIDAADALIDFETAKPEPAGHDIRVAVKAISANPVDYKVRKRATPAEGDTKILGFDASGVVDAIGPDVTLFKVGDEVFYAGSIQRQGPKSEFPLSGERICGRQAHTAAF